MQNLKPSFGIAFALVFALSMSGCASRVILVPNGEPVRLAEPAKVRVWIIDSSGQEIRSQNRVVIPAGWYALPKD